VLRAQQQITEANRL